MPIPLVAAAAVSGGLSILQGVFSYLEGTEMAGIAESRARVLRLEAETDAQRYAEQADQFKATQKLAYLKSGVELSGSPLDILDETARVSRENISAIRAGGEARAFEARLQGAEATSRGRAALIGGVFDAAKTGLLTYAQSRQNAQTATTPRNNTGYNAGGGARAER